MKRRTFLSHGGALLALAQQSQTLPKIFYTYSSTEYWARVGSLATTTVDGAQDVLARAHVEVLLGLRPRPVDDEVGGDLHL